MSRSDVSRETRPRRVTVVGTGTGVGKTFVSVALVRALAGRGLRVCGLKPIESGVSEGVLTDAEQLARVSTVPVGVAPYRLAKPVSPHMAAREEGVVLSVETAARWVEEEAVKAGAEVQVVETAGALMSPLGVGVSNLDLARALRGDALVLVGLDRLGVLHEVAVCLLALKTLAPELPEAVVVLNEPAAEGRDASTGTNAGELVGLGVVRAGVGVGVVPRGEQGEGAVVEAVLGVVGRLGW